MTETLGKITDEPPDWLPDRVAALAKAATLIEALPWLDRFHGATVVIKFGGHAMADEALRLAFAQDVVFLRFAGLRPVIDYLANIVHSIDIYNKPRLSPLYCFINI